MAALVVDEKCLIWKAQRSLHYQKPFICNQHRLLATKFLVTSHNRTSTICFYRNNFCGGKSRVWNGGCAIHSPFGTMDDELVAALEREWASEVSDYDALIVDDTDDSDDDEPNMSVAEDYEVTAAAIARALNQPSLESPPDPTGTVFHQQRHLILSMCPSVETYAPKKKIART